MPTVVVYGPRASGKTRNKDALMKHYGTTHSVDEWVPGLPVSNNSLVLTSVPVQGAIHIDDALAAAGITGDIFPQE